MDVEQHGHDMHELFSRTYARDRMRGAQAAALAHRRRRAASSRRRSVLRGPGPRPRSPEQDWDLAA